MSFLGARRTVLIDNTLFVGACAWFDFQFALPENSAEACQAQFASVAEPQRWFSSAPAPGAPPVDQAVLSLARADAAHVRAAVCAAQHDSSVSRIVVVTHTVPHRSLLRKGVYPKALIEAGFYGSSMMEAVPEADVNRKIALWCFGHSHAGADATLGHVRYLSHPRGRPDDFGRAEYAPRNVVLGSDEAPAEEVKAGSGGGAAAVCAAPSRMREVLLR